MGSYAKLVKEITRINVSEEKSLELKTKIASLKHPVRQTRDTRKLYDLKKLNKRMQKSSVSLADLRIHNENMPSRTSTQNSAKPGLRQAKSNLKLGIQDGSGVKRPNYLSELRKKRELSISQVGTKSYDWNLDLNNSQLNTAEKYNKIINKANELEKQANRKEKIYLEKGKHNLSLSENITDMFLGAIKAKLSLLEQL